MTDKEVRIINGKEVVLYRHKELGSYLFSEDAVEMLLKVLEEVEQYRAIGTVEEIRSKLEAYKELGTIEELKSAVERMKGADMADIMTFPNTMQEFVESYSFIDIDEVYTNGSMLVPTFRVEQGLEYYEKEIRNKAIDEFAEKLMTDVESFVGVVNGMRADLLTLDYFCEFVGEVAEQIREVRND